MGTLIGGQAAAATPRGAKGPLRVRIVMFDGVEEQDFIAPQEVLSLAGWYSSRKIDTGYTVLGRPRVITAAFGTRVTVDRGWRPEEADVIVVPGGGRPGEPGIWTEINSGALPKALAAARRPGLTISSLCTGAIILAAAGLVTSLTATVPTPARSSCSAAFWKAFSSTPSRPARPTHKNLSTSGPCTS
ncbi:DJ-1/PfpI family protein [Micromonospora ureilytica]|uniref:DJ-1/PfpI family protein n=1 Tax=Micromonospora ureilytica TaxID=709868 RepID=UPI0040396A34